MVSLSSVTDFLATWEDGRVEDELSAPRLALPHLGMLPDRNLLGASDGIADRLLRNFSLTREISRMTGSRLDEVRRKVKRGAAAKRKRGLDVLARVERIRRVGDFGSLSALEYEDARAVFKKPIPEEPPALDPEPSQESKRDIEDGPGIAVAGGESLIDGDEETLSELVDSVPQAVADAVDGDEDAASGQYETREDERGFEFKIEREVLTWVRHFCSEEAWGGFFESTTGSFDESIAGYAQCEPTLTAASRSVDRPCRRAVRRPVAPV